MAKKKHEICEEELNRLVDERMKEYEMEFLKEHTPTIEMKYGQTFIEFFNMDYININTRIKIGKLLDLMNADYAYGISGKGDGTYYFTLDGEDPERAAFIQTFVDNGYKLTWK